MKYYPLPQIKGKSRYKDFYIFLGKYYCSQNNIDMTFEKNEGPGLRIDLKRSRGNDKTEVEIKLSSNADYIHGYEEQIEQYVKAEGTTQKSICVCESWKSWTR